MNNSELCKIFKDIADFLEIKGENPFKIRAYRNAARSIEKLPEEVEKLVGEDRLKGIPGIGEAITKKIEELVATGRLEFYEKLRAEFPEGISVLLHVPTIGPKTAVTLNRDLGINTLEELEAALTNGRVASLPHMGETKARHLLEELRTIKPTATS